LPAKGFRLEGQELGICLLSYSHEQPHKARISRASCTVIA
jgi:hypothetical protein